MSDRPTRRARCAASQAPAATSWAFCWLAEKKNRQVMQLELARYSRDALAALSQSERDVRLREMEAIANADLKGAETLAEFQERLYKVIDELGALGHWLGPWEYDCEIECWGGKSYMDPSIKNELMLKSHYPHGIELRWEVFDWQL